LPKLGLWVVADGMGGHEAGEVASGIAIREIARRIEQGMPAASRGYRNSPPCDTNRRSARRGSC